MSQKEGENSVIGKKKLKIEKSQRSSQLLNIKFEPNLHTCSFPQACFSR